MLELPPESHIALSLALRTALFEFEAIVRQVRQMIPPKVYHNYLESKILTILALRTAIFELRPFQDQCTK